MAIVSGPAQPNLYPNDACASVRRNRFLTPDLLAVFRQQRARVRYRLAAIPDAPKPRAAYVREYDWSAIEAERGTRIKQD